MKKVIFPILILCISFSIKAQTKKETVNYINNKLSVYALDSNNIKYKYAIKESSANNTVLHADTFIMSYDFSQFYSPLPIKDFAITDKSVGNKKTQKSIQSPIFSLLSK
ncbi:MAG: hypothetical protein WBG43_05545 [Marinifilaceae bacterium]